MKLHKQIYPGLRRLIKRKEKESNGIEDKIFFLHIPKCGGNSLNRAITTQEVDKFT